MNFSIEKDYSSILLHNGTILQHDSSDNVQVLHNMDVFIEHDRIKRIGYDLKSSVSSSTVVLDCTDKIISPGFIDAHHHVWQTQLKGRHGNDTLLDYIPTGNLQYHHYTPDDLFWGQLSGNLELIDGGTTTVVDHSHALTSPEHVDAALNGTTKSGIRSVFCYGPVSMHIRRWTSDSFDVERSGDFPEWFFPQLKKLATQLPASKESNVQLGLFFDSYAMPVPKVQNVFTKARQSGAKLITSHFRHFPLPTGQDKIPELLDAAGLLGPDVLLSHGNGISETQVKLLREHSVHIVTTPDAEVFMASGQEPVAFREDLQPLTCLGADCHSAGPGNMLHQMQTAMANDRASQTNNAFNQGKYPARFRATVQAAFNLATIRGAKAIGMAHDVGSLHESKLADIVIFDTSTPVMACAVEQDPLAAVVRHAGTREIDTVIIGGRVRKFQGNLLPIAMAGLGTRSDLLSSKSSCTDMSWTDIAKELRTSRRRINDRAQGANTEIVKGVLVKMLRAEDSLL